MGKHMLLKKYFLLCLYITISCSAIAKHGNTPSVFDLGQRHFQTIGANAPFLNQSITALAQDKQGQLVFLADSAFSLQMTQQKYPSLDFHFSSEF